MAECDLPRYADTLAKIDLFSGRWARLALVAFLLSVIISSLYIGAS
jgi:hypothetical protein